jgi:ABC-2 type transport system permease protein
MIVRNQVGAIIGLLAWGFVVENLLFALAPSVGRLTPGQAQNAFMGLTTSHLLSPAAGGVVLLAWTVVLCLAGTALTARRDVN